MVLSEDEQTVITCYRDVHPKRLRGEIPEKTLRLIRSALAGYPVSDLCKAIRGNAASQFHKDHNHLGLNLILRDADKIDYFIGLYDQSNPNEMEMTDEFGRMVLHRKNAAGKWEAVAS